MQPTELNETKPPENKILAKMLDRLFASMMNGPSLNCKPHSSRQRLDLMQFEKLKDIDSYQILHDLLGEKRSAKITARVPMPPKMERNNFGKGKKKSPASPTDENQPDQEKPESDPTGNSSNSAHVESPSTSLNIEADEKSLDIGESKNTRSKDQADKSHSPEQAAEVRAWKDQQSIISKLRAMAEDAKTYENDTGVHVLHVGFPLLSLPPGSGGVQKSAGRRVLAPLAFITVNVTIRGGASPGVTIECRHEGEDMVTANMALIAWLDQQTGKTESADLFTDVTGEHPWEEIAAIVKYVANRLNIPIPRVFDIPGVAEKANADGTLAAEARMQPITLQPAPRTEDLNAKPCIINSAILGLFPTSNQGLLRDMKAMAAGASCAGPVESFIHVDASQLTAAHPQPDPNDDAETPVVHRARVVADERLISAADPCQSRAIKLARTSRGLVIHGPPGTGKSQTITNIIGDHLARGQRVLLVCDKRAALDVVMHRLEASGLGQLCGIVHDPQRDQRDLYKSIREQLEALAEVKTNARAENQLNAVDSELQRLHHELSKYYSALMQAPDSNTTSFHELMGKWLTLQTSLESANIEFNESLLAGVATAELAQHEHDLQDIFARAQSVNYVQNPWAGACGMPLSDFLSKPMDHVRHAMSTNVEPAKIADATMDPSIPPFHLQIDLTEQAQKRALLAAQLLEIQKQVDPSIINNWSKADARTVHNEHKRLSDVSPQVEVLRSGPLDTELALMVKTQLPTMSQIAQRISLLDEYIGIAGKWYAFICLSKKKAALQVMSSYGLSLNLANANRLKQFLTAFGARLGLQSLYEELTRQPTLTQLLPPDQLLDSSMRGHSLLFNTLIFLHDDASLQPLAAQVTAAMRDSNLLTQMIASLEKSTPRANALVALESSMTSSHLYETKWLAEFSGRLRNGQSAGNTIEALSSSLNTVESVLRIRQTVGSLNAPLRAASLALLQQSVNPETALAVLQKSIFALQISDRLKSDPTLQAADSQKLKTGFDRYRLLDTQKKQLVREVTLHLWVSKQKQRLLASTFSRLNGDGAELRRRLTIRGEHAMRLRQVISTGQETEGGDPLFDMRPVWMASPETVAQIFPRKAIFDVVIFDEASQCRLEEALPVLLRATRVVVAGDPKQLPPTRFFESALVASEEDEIESDQQLFEIQQGDIEDLLSAALNIEIEQSYLDVHYRSRNADLIEFSNKHFYGSRLQSIPGHPSHRARYAPLTLYKCYGVYEDRSNIVEARQVCKIVQDLLRRATPPSIGIACFNLQQRNVIVEELEELAAADADFGKRLEEARNLKHQGSFAGLFVKNLESVQGDERDHMIISTTFGPDPTGRFYNRFGPLGRSGGGRRLNVLVTRAREEVHLVTSIPESVYCALPPIPAGETPGGGWLLFSYLHFAQELSAKYETAHHLLEQIEPDAKAVVNICPARYPSQFSQAFAAKLAGQNNIGSDVHWGNDGFCVDLALHHPRRAEDVTVGVISDLTRFAQAEDPVEWEVFRTAILEAQGWQLHRLWTPHFYRDMKGRTEAIVNEVNHLLANEQEKDTIRVVKDE